MKPPTNSILEYLLGIQYDTFSCSCVSFLVQIT